MTAHREGRFFQFHPQAQLVRGAVGAVVHDLFAARVYWFKEARVADALSALALGDAIEDAARSAGLEEAQLEAYVEVLVRLKLGARAARRTAVEGYRPVLLRSQAREHQIAPAGRTVTVELSSRCVHACGWCTSRNVTSPRACACGVWEDGAEALPIDILLAALEQLTELGVERVVVRGGEPFLERAALCAVLDVASRLGLSCDVHTTGMLIQAADVEELRGRRVRLALLIASADDAEFDAATGAAGNGARLRALLPRLGAAGVPFVAKVPTIVGALEGALRCAAWARGAGAAGVEHLLHLPNGSVEESRCAFGPRSPADLAADLSGFHRNGDGHACFDGHTFIARDGTVSPCAGFRRPIGTLKSSTMAEIVRRDEPAFACSTARRWMASCRRCEFRMGCWACLARTAEVEGSASGPHWTCRYSPATGEWKAT